MDVSLCLTFPFWTISLLLACGSADSTRARADAAWSNRVALSCCVPISATTTRHWKRKKGKANISTTEHASCLLHHNWHSWTVLWNYGSQETVSLVMSIKLEEHYFYRCSLTPLAFFCLPASSLWPKLNWFHSSSLNQVRSDRMGSADIIFFIKVCDEFYHCISPKQKREKWTLSHPNLSSSTASSSSLALGYCILLLQASKNYHRLHTSRELQKVSEYSVCTALWQEP